MKGNKCPPLYSVIFFYNSCLTFKLLFLALTVTFYYDSFAFLLIYPFFVLLLPILPLPNLIQLYLFTLVSTPYSMLQFLVAYCTSPLTLFTLPCILHNLFNNNLNTHFKIICHIYKHIQYKLYIYVYIQTNQTYLSLCIKT